MSKRKKIIRLESCAETEDFVELMEHNRIAIKQLVTARSLIISEKVKKQQRENEEKFIRKLKICGAI